jgi:GT2 family glycosyltransferase
MDSHTDGDVLSRPAVQIDSILEEAAFWAFYLPRGGIQRLARHLPLAAVRDWLPRAWAERLRFGLYPARITDPAPTSCARSHAPWGVPTGLDPDRPVRCDLHPAASILIVTYGQLDLTRLCLASLQRAAGETPFEVIVIDNASTDGTVAYLREVQRSALLPLRVVENGVNRGFAAANNQAAALARAERLVLLNNDTVVTPGWLERLLGHLDRDPTIGLIGPRTNSCGNEAALPVPYRDLGEMFRFAEQRAQERAGQTHELPMITLFCAALARSRFRALGGLDERYRVGMFEDDDLSMSVRRAGQRVVVAEDVFVHHYGGAAFSRLSPERYLRIWWDNRRRFEKKWRTKWIRR